MPQASDTDNKPAAQQEIIGLDRLQYAQGVPANTAVLKQDFADFQVDEELGFDLSGSGEHLFLRIRKTDLSTNEVVKQLGNLSRSGLAVVGYSGMKDRRGECTQWFSLPLAAQDEGLLAELESDKVKILETQRNSRKLKTGSHRANHFRIILRGCSGEQADYDQRLAALLESGVPNYFGEQRFGRNMSNLVQVQEMIQSELEKAGPKGRVRRKPGGRFRQGMLYSAARSYLFNQLLSARLEQGNWDQYQEGDVLNLNGTSRYFVPEDNQWDEELQRRLDEFDIHLSGPLAGISSEKDRYASTGKAADIEDAVLKESPLLVKGLIQFGLRAARRPLRFKPGDLKWQWLGNSTLELEFSLFRGSYATSLLREVCKTEERVEKKIETNKS